MADTTGSPAHVTVRPPLNEQEIEFLLGFAHRDPFDHAARRTRAVERVRRVWRGQPGAWSPWVPCLDGCCLKIDRTEPAAHAAVWLRFLIREFLRRGATASSRADRPEGFSFDHRIDGKVTVRGDGLVDLRTVTVVSNRVAERRVTVRYDETWSPPVPPRRRSTAARRRRGTVVDLDVRRRRETAGE